MGSDVDRDRATQRAPEDHDLASPGAAASCGEPRPPVGIEATLIGSACRVAVAAILDGDYRQAQVGEHASVFQTIGHGAGVAVQEDQHRAASVPYLHANREAVDYFQGPYPPDGRRCLVVYTVDEGSRVRASQQRIEQAIGEDGIVKVMAQPRYGADQVAIEVHGPTATKWSALQWLLRRWEVKSREVVAVGDDVNDIPMLRAAGLSFAMGNASDEVKAAASAVTASNDEHGVAEALRSAFKELIPNGARRGT